MTELQNAVIEPSSRSPEACMSCSKYMSSCILAASFVKQFLFRLYMRCYRKLLAAEQRKKLSIK